MTHIELSIPLTPPSVNHAWKHAVINGQLRSYSTALLKAYKAAVAVAAAGRTIAPKTDKERAKVAYAVTALIVLGKGQRLDADNAGKALMDGLQAAGVIHSDARVRRVTLEVCWNRRDVGPRTEIRAEVCEC